MNRRMVVLGDVEPNTIQAFLVRQSVVPSSSRQGRIRFRPYGGAEVIDEWPTLRRTKQAGALQYN